MAKSPKEPKDIFTDIITDYKTAFGDDLISIILYGSATGKDYRPGKSDINFMIVLTEQGIERIDAAFDIIKKWQKRNVAIPLFLTEAYVATSLDVFPIEYLNFHRNYELVFGKDILKDLTFDGELIRLQCEREIKGKLLILREAFLETTGKGKPLKQLIGHSISAFVAIFEALLYLKGRELPRTKKEVVKATAAEFDMDAALFDKLLDVKDERVKPGDLEVMDLFKEYLREVRKLAKLVDTLGGQHE
jgi:predicted nucleotidyltransferase